MFLLTRAAWVSTAREILLCSSWTIGYMSSNWPHTALTLYSSLDHIHLASSSLLPLLPCSLQFLSQSFDTMSTCLCSQCFPGKLRNPRTIIRHLKDDHVLLYSSGIVHSQQTVAHLQRCITANELKLSAGGYGMSTLALPKISNSDVQFNLQTCRLGRQQQRGRSLSPWGPWK